MIIIIKSANLNSNERFPPIGLTKLDISIIHDYSFILLQIMKLRYYLKLFN